MFSSSEPKYDFSNFSKALLMLIQTGLLATNDVYDSCPKTSIIDGVSLTPREIDCLRLLHKGMSAKQIAKNLGLSHRTVENYIANMKSKLSVSTKAELLSLEARYHY